MLLFGPGSAQLIKEISYEEVVKFTGEKSVFLNTFANYLKGEKEVSDDKK